MYFSLIRPADGHEREAAHDWISGPYDEHRWLWRFFAASDIEKRDFLYRRVDREGLPRFYVVSKRCPNTLDGARWRIDTRPYSPKLPAGLRLHFELRANPVVSHGRESKSKRHDVVMEAKKRLLAARGLARWSEWDDPEKPDLYALIRDACGAWLNARAARLGFALDERGVAVDAYQRHAEKGGRLQFSTVDFSGQLTITDASSFQGALYNGIGHAKAFGCGLLLVRPM
jgi:CRISPR system Cascade subunit CasE